MSRQVRLQRHRLSPTGIQDTQRDPSHIGTPDIAAAPIDTAVLQPASPELDPPRFGHDFGKISILPPGTPPPTDPAGQPVQREAHVRIEPTQPRWREQMEASFRADFSDIAVQRDSAEAVEIGARAFTEGNAIHLAPGAPNSDSPAGRELLGHELAHVVQQRERRAAPLAHLQSGTDGKPVDNSDHLETEARLQGRRAARGLPARQGGGFSNPSAHPRPVVQGAFTVSAKIIPNEADESEFPAADVNLNGIQMTEKKRPPTRLSGSQGRHIVAWQAKAQYWRAHFRDVPFDQALDQLYAMAYADEQIDRGAGEAGQAGREARERLLDRLGKLENGATKPISEWMELMSWALTTYIKSYQQSSFAAFPSVNPKGRNEAGHLSNLRSWNDLLSVGSVPDVQESVTKTGKGAKKRRTAAGSRALSRADVLAAARGLIDLHPGLPGPVLHKVFTDWLSMLTALFPTLFQAAAGQPAFLIKPADDEVNKLNTLGYPQVDSLFHQMVGLPPTADIDTYLDDATAEPEEEQEEDEDLEAQTDADQLRETEPFLVRVEAELLTGAEDTYGASDLFVERLSVSDERPPTRFGNRQMSHTIPWSLERLSWVRRFSHETLDNVIQALTDHLGEEQEWSKAYTAIPVTQRRDEILADLDAALEEGYPISEWTHWLNETIEAYVTLYQLSPFATYATEGTQTGVSTAQGKGEAKLLQKFRGWEDDLANGKDGPSGAEVKAEAQKLVDVPQLTEPRARVDIDKLKNRWLDELATVFPNVADQFGDQLEQAYDAAAQQTAFSQALGALTTEPRVLTRSERVASGKRTLADVSKRATKSPSTKRPMKGKGSTSAASAKSKKRKHV